MIINRVITIPLVLITEKTEEVIHDVTAGGGDLDLVGSHMQMLAEECGIATLCGILYGEVQRLRNERGPHANVSVIKGIARTTPPALPSDCRPDS